MAGGIGSRFWPMSRNNFPKQFHDFLGLGKSLLQQTVERFLPVAPQENIYIVTNKDYYHLVKQQLPWMDDHQILLEPMGKNTAPCVVYACTKIAHKNPEANFVIAPSDHHITKPEEFARVISNALAITAKNDVLLTLGIKPHRPDTGYGYIKFSTEETLDGANKVKTFTEKPQLDLAKKFLESGDYVWNAGIFIWNSKAIQGAVTEFLADLEEIFNEGKDTFYTDAESAFIETAYPQCRSVSIDYGIMEKSSVVYTLLSDFGWSDLGTWKSLYDLASKDTAGNVTDGNIMLYDTKNCIVKSTNPNSLIVVQGLNNFIVAESDGVIMICNKDEEQKVKNFVADTKAKQDKKFI